MRRFSIFILFLAVSALPLGSGFAAKAKKSPADAPFETLKSLQGTWKGQIEMDGKKEEATLVYKVTSGGTALEETIFAGSPKEMVSVYFQDKDRVMMTHYCALGNQPRMQVTESAKGKIRFEMVDATGMKTPQDPHMGGLTLTLKDKDRFEQAWVHYNPDGTSNTSVFAWERVK
ncbi:hypothetical protein FBR05_04170 [Deltaproteobacteria bacterium PRO3]|nr:hypothetical protein [Deltaproteobacteria bacterium PRO3]